MSKKKLPWITSFLFTAAPLLGQTEETLPACCKSCCPKRAEILLNCAYNAPARIVVDPCSTWDLFFTASFLYWQAIQDNMEVAVSLKTDAGYEFFDTTPGRSTASRLLGHDFTYKPGFKILSGMNFGRDQWGGYAEYTWFRNTTCSKVSRSDTAESNYGLTPSRGNPFLLESIANGGPSFATAVFDEAIQTWQLNVQSLDLAIIRPYYAGEKLTVRILFGARSAWFTQTTEAVFTDNAKLSEEGPSGIYTMKQNYSSWGIGLLSALRSNWRLGRNFSLIGDGSFDLLYTRVSSCNSRFEWTETISLPVIYKFPDNRPDFLMPHTNLEWGFGWRSYFDCYNWHVDFAATYGFQVFWNANLFRNFTSKAASLSQAPTGNLYIHGLNLSGRLDF